MEINAIEEFSKLIVKDVRDRTIKECDRILLNNRTEICKRWEEALASSDTTKILHVLIPDIVEQPLEIFF